MSREAREKKLRAVWRRYLTAGHRWTRQEVAREVGVRVEDVQRLIDEAGPTKVMVIDRGGSGHCCHHKRLFEGRLRAIFRPPGRAS